MNHDFEDRFLDYFARNPESDKDGSHDVGHFSRVARNSLKIASKINQPVDTLILTAASYFHDIVSLPKNHPENKFSSRYSAKKAATILNEMRFPSKKIPAVCHAIETHSFSANLNPQTIEAKIIQDADRLESLGALGIMRVFYVSGMLKRAPYDPEDLFATQRPLDDKAFGLDHFYRKLFKLPSLMQTDPGQELSFDLAKFMELFVGKLAAEITKGEGALLSVVHSCYEGGGEYLKLFHLDDPMGTTRSLNAEKFVIDRIIDRGSDQFFLDQFIKEVHCGTF